MYIIRGEEYFFFHFTGQCKFPFPTGKARENILGTSVRITQSLPLLFAMQNTDPSLCSAKPSEFLELSKERDGFVSPTLQKDSSTREGKEAVEK